MPGSAQQHRRFIKTHTPLDGLPLDARVTYIVVARHPLDMAISLYHHCANLNTRRISDLAGRPESGLPAAAPPLREWLLAWIGQDPTPQERPDSLPGVMWHLRDAWSRRSQPNVVLLHYDDLSTTLEHEMRSLAGGLGITVPAHAWPGLVTAATFDGMRARASHLAQGPSGVLKDDAAFFRHGQSGSHRAVLTAQELARYHARTAEMAPPEALNWLHRA